jgi:transcriptional regulator
VGAQEMTSPFERVGSREVVDLIEAFPLAWVVSCGPDGFGATPLPIMVETNDAGEPRSLIGHFARSNPQVALLEHSPRALFLFQGPHAYISPSWISNRTWAPTWNYAVIRIEADVRFVADGADAVLERLVDKMERGRPGAWSIDEMGARYARLRTGIVAFEAEIRTLRPRFKLGQEETPAVLGEILAHTGDEGLNAWMRRLNPE